METNFEIENYGDYNNQYKIEVKTEMKLTSSDYEILVGAFTTISDLLDPSVDETRAFKENEAEERKDREVEREDAGD